MGAAGGKIVCAWGAHAGGRPEAEQLIRGLTVPFGYLVYTLWRLANGTTAHPVRLPYTCELERY